MFPLRYAKFNISESSDTAPNPKYLYQFALELNCQKDKNIFQEGQEMSLQVLKC